MTSRRDFFKASTAGLAFPSLIDSLGFDLSKALVLEDTRQKPIIWKNRIEKRIIHTKITRPRVLYLSCVFPDCPITIAGPATFINCMFSGREKPGEALMHIKKGNTTPELFTYIGNCLILGGEDGERFSEFADWFERFLK
jgi:hypothetical protein